MRISDHSIQFNSNQFNSISFNSNIGVFQHIQGLSSYQNYIGVYYPELTQTPGKVRAAAGDFSEKMEEQLNWIEFNSIHINFRSFRSFSKSSRSTSNSINSFILYKQTQSIQFKK